MEARIAWDNAVGEAVGHVAVLSGDDPAEAETSDGWVRVNLVHTSEDPGRYESGETIQGVNCVATCYAPHGEQSLADKTAETIRASVANGFHGGLQIGQGRFADVRDEDEDNVDNFAGLRVTFPATYEQEG